MHRALSPLLFLSACADWSPPEPDATTTMAITGIHTLPTTVANDTSGWEFPEHGPPDVQPLPPPLPPGGTSGAEATSSGSWGPTTDPGETGVLPATVELAALRIAEVLPDPAGKDGGPMSPEFIEILNYSGSATPLAGLEIVARAWPVLDADDLGIADETLEAGARLVVLRYAQAADLPDPAVVVDEHGVTAAFAHGDGLRNADGGVLLRAEEEDGDLVIFGAAQPAPWDSPDGWFGAPVAAPGSGVSLCRNGDEDHDDATDFTTCAPSPGQPPQEEADGTTGEAANDTTDGTTGEALPAEVVIVEVLSNPPGPGNGEKALEFVELLNLGPGDVDLASWTIADAIAEDADGVDPLLHKSGDGGCAPSTCLAAGGRAIVVGNAYTGPTGPGLVLVTDDTTIANAGLGVHEAVVVRDGDGVVRSTYRVWPDPKAAPDPSMIEEALVRDPLSADAPEAWTFATPTPGD